MAIQNVQATANSNQSSPGRALTERTVTQDEFLRLLIAQLQNQDPLQPMDNQEFAAQLATFNSLGQLIEINDKLGELKSGQGSLNQYNAASLIGREIAAAGNLVKLGSGSSATIGYRLGANAAKVAVSIFNANGELVRRIDAGARSSGDNTLVWDGNDATGKSAPKGTYRFEIDAVDANGRKIPVLGTIQGVVTGVKLYGAEPVLEVNGIDVPLSSVITVRVAH